MTPLGALESCVILRMLAPRSGCRADSPMIITLRPLPLLSSCGSAGGFSAVITAAVGPDGPLMSRARRGRRLLLGI